MKNYTLSLPFRQSETIVDPLTELAREGARRMRWGLMCLIHKAGYLTIWRASKGVCKKVAKVAPL
jgi:hypothetical protein